MSGNNQFMMNRRDKSFKNLHTGDAKVTNDLDVGGNVTINGIILAPNNCYPYSTFSDSVLSNVIAFSADKFDAIGVTKGADRNLYVTTQGTAAGDPRGVLKVQPNGTTSIFANLPFIAGAYSRPHMIAYNEINGNLYVAARNSVSVGAIYEVDSTGANTLYFTDPDLKFVWGVTVDTGGNVYTSDSRSGNIWKITGPGTGSVWKETGIIGAFNFNGVGSIVIDSKSENMYGAITFSQVDANASTKLFKIPIFPNGVAGDVIEFDTSSVPGATSVPPVNRFDGITLDESECVLLSTYRNGIVATDLKTEQSKLLLSVGAIDDKNNNPFFTSIVTGEGFGYGNEDKLFGINYSFNVAGIVSPDSGVIELSPCRWRTLAGFPC